MVIVQLLTFKCFSVKYIVTYIHKGIWTFPFFFSCSSPLRWMGYLILHNNPPIGRPINLGPRVGEEFPPPLSKTTNVL